MHLTQDRKRTLIIGLVAIVILGSAAATYHYYTRPQIPSNEIQVRSLVYGFGDQLRMVPLLGEAETVSKDMDTYYAFYVRPDLLTTWKSQPRTAPGRLTSSPFPDRVEIQSLALNADGTYTVNATVVSKANGTGTSTPSTETPVRIVAAQGPDGWQISSYEVVTK